MEHPACVAKKVDYCVFNQLAVFGDFIISNSELQ